MEFWGDASLLLNSQREQVVAYFCWALQYLHVNPGTLAKGNASVEDAREEEDGRNLITGVEPLD